MEKVQTRPPLYNLAHRGARSLAPENTMAAIKKAFEIGAHGIEVDVRISADGHFILMHDPTLRRTTDVHLRFPERANDPVETFTLEELQQLDTGSWFVDSDPFGEIAAGTVSAAEAERLRGARIPRISEVLAFVKNNRWFINIEIKELPDPKRVGVLLALIDAIRLPVTWVSISSFRHSYLRHLQEVRPEIEVNALIGESETEPQDWGNYEFQIYNANVDLTDEIQIARALEHGCQVNLFTVNEPEQMKRFLQAGVSKIITDFPQRLGRLHLD